MNRLILQYGRVISAVILVVFAWVVYQRISRGWSEVVPLAITAAVVWALALPAFVVLWPSITLGGFRRAILRRGFGGGPIPVNTLSVAAPTSSASEAPSLLDTGTDSVLYLAGWLDLRRGPQVLEVPDMTGRYYSLQFADPSTGANVAYVGTRATGSSAGSYLITGPGSTQPAASGRPRIALPHRSALVIGRVFTADEDDRRAASALAERIRIGPLEDDGR